MTDRPTILQQLVGIPEIRAGVWDVCATYRDKGDVLTSALYFYPSMRYPTTVSWNVTIRMSNGSDQHFGSMFRRYQDDDVIVCLRFDIGKFKLDLFWDNNISVVPMGEVVK